jgi:hypothetical protein
MKFFVLFCFVFLTEGDVPCFDVEEEEDDIIDEELASQFCNVPSQQEFSLLDWIGAPDTRQQRRRHLSSVHAEETATRAVNSASDKVVKKFYGKGMAIFVDREEAEDDDDTGITTTDVTMSDADSGHHSGDELDAPFTTTNASSVFDFAGELAKSDNSFSACLFPASELNTTYLRENLGSGVTFGSCVPLTAKINMAAACDWLGREVEERLVMERGEWRLICQEGNVPSQELPQSLATSDTLACFM